MNILKKAFDLFIETGMPARCLLCKERTDHQGTLCAPCWTRLDFITDPVCQSCGYPFEFTINKGALCGSCITDPPLKFPLRSPLHYGGGAKPLIGKFKRRDCSLIAPTFAQWMVKAGNTFLQDADLLIPVPLHWWREWRRRYNQSAVLAERISHQTSVPVVYNALNRSKATPPQSGGIKNRQKNVKGAFKVRKEGVVRGQKIVLIDDVFTTGATLSECTKVLKAAGAKHVAALTVARVVKPLPAKT